MAEKMKDTESVHCVSNGRVICYGRGAEIINFYAPFYSAPSLGKLIFADGDYSSESRREPGALIWRHAVAKDGKKIGEFTDFVLPDSDICIRSFDMRGECRMPFMLHPAAVLREENIFSIPSGTPLSEASFNAYPCPLEIFLKIEASPGACLRDGILIFEGKGHFSFFFDTDYERIKAASVSDLSLSFSQTMRYWKERSGKVLFPIFDRIGNKYADIIEGLYFCLISQASADGGGIAGHNYNLCYVRDQYGVSKGYLALGILGEARKLLEYYLAVFNRYGKIANAQSMGYCGVLHEHENDESEITGYLIIQAFDYFNVTEDREFLLSFMPVLVWAFEKQAGTLHKNMLPFNGDETYIAGGILPRTAIDDGSFESTMLFLRGAELILDFCAEYSFPEKDGILRHKEAVCTVKKDFRDNFFMGGKVRANNPERRKGLKYKPERNGLCPRCQKYFGALRFVEGGYTCPSCLCVSTVEADIGSKTYDVSLLALMPSFIGSDIFSSAELRSFAERLVKYHKRYGRLSQSKRSVGYEYGLFLNLLCDTGNPYAGTVFDELLSLIDDKKSFAEYYDGSKPFNTRYRPWESAINLAAILKYLLKNEGADEQ